MTARMMAVLVAAALCLAWDADCTANAFEAERAFARGTKILGRQANRGYNAHTGILGVSCFFH